MKKARRKSKNTGENLGPAMVPMGRKRTGKSALTQYHIHGYVGSCPGPKSIRAPMLYIYAICIPVSCCVGRAPQCTALQGGGRAMILLKRLCRHAFVISTIESHG